MNKMVRRTLIPVVLFIIMLFISSCASNKVQLSPQEQLEKEINKWQSFHMEGMAEVNVSSFVIRKYFVCQKYSHSMQFDLLNSGLMGAEPAPLVSIKVDDQLTVESPYKDMVQSMLIRSGLKQMNISQYLDFKTLLKDKMPEILATGKTTIGNNEVRFQKNMQLKQIISHDQKQNFQVQYRNGEPNTITIDIAKLAKIKMQVEQFVDTSCCDSLANQPSTQR